MRWFLLPAALLLAAAGPPPLAGDYALVGVHEAAGGLQLLPDGRFRYSRGTQTGGQITGGVTEVHGGSAASAPARAGRYRFVDYTLELRFDDGETIRAAAFFWDNTRDDLVIDGLTYTR